MSQGYTREGDAMSYITIGIAPDTRDHADSFMLRHPDVNFPGIIERFMVKFMLDYEAKEQLTEMLKDGVQMEVVEDTVKRPRAVETVDALSALGHAVAEFIDKKESEKRVRRPGRIIVEADPPGPLQIAGIQIDPKDSEKTIHINPIIDEEGQIRGYKRSDLPDDMQERLERDPGFYKMPLHPALRKTRLTQFPYSPPEQGA